MISHGLTGLCEASFGPTRVQSKKSAEKSTIKTGFQKKHHQDKPKKHHQDTAKKHLDIINPVPLLGVVGVVGFKELLRIHHQLDWCSRVRVGGSLLLIDYAIRHMDKNGHYQFSAELARSFVSKLRRVSHSDVEKEPLRLLCLIGIFEVVRPAVFAHIKAPAVYCFAEKYRDKQKRIFVSLTAKLAEKREKTPQRCERGLNRKYPFREHLLADLNAVSFAPAARVIIAKKIKGNGGDNLRQLICAIDGPNHVIRVSQRGQITTSLGSCPRELQPYLLLHNEPVTSCDISHAHWNFLPLILADRLRYVSEEAGRENYVRDGWREHDRLLAVLSKGDFYRRWCSDSLDDVERTEKKNVLNMLLNKRNDECQRNRLYRRIANEFPIIFGVIQDIKRGDHRNLSKQLHRFTADAISEALVEVQQQGISAIPLVDTLICQQQHRQEVCRRIGNQIFLATGVCAKVGGIRYSPLTEEEQQALAFDEEAPSGDGLSYDEWEERRTAKCRVALRYLELLSRFASHGALL
ncbi:MAG: hypothetical protein ACREIF_04380 [Chthoniobacterales bacterium]